MLTENNALNFNQYRKPGVIASRYLRAGHVVRVRKEFFSEHVVNDWNNLPSQIVNAKSMNIFRSLLNRDWANFQMNTV